MPFTKLQFKPGINRETTFYANEGGWYDGDKIRFRFGMPEKIGGWVRKSSNSFLGRCRALHPWVSLAGDKYLGVGTTEKYYIESGGTFYDITPIRATTAAGDVTFSATNGSSTLTVSDTAHGAIVGDYVTFSGAVQATGSITSAMLNQEYKIASVIDDDSYTVKAREVATLASITVDGQYTPTEVTWDGSTGAIGGSATVGAYQINIGLDTAIFGTGWGAGPWGSDGWGEANTSGVETSLRLWSHDNFGEDLVFNVRDGEIYYWDATNGLSTRAVDITTLVGATDSPTVAKQVLVSDRDRHLIAFGCNPEATTPKVQDPLVIRFSSQESLTDWETTATNTAGQLRIGSGSEIITAVETRQQILVFTDESLYAMQYLGFPYTFGINLISENTNIIGPNSAVAVDDAVFWMGLTEFYSFQGSVQRIPCTVRDYVFDNINREQSEKIICGLNSENAEIWWYYCSSGSEDLDRYVIYNYQEQAWYYGNLSRTAWVDRGINDFPIAAAPDGYLYEHERGFDDGSTNPPTAIAANIQSSPIDIGEGDQFMFITRVLPDVNFLNSSSGSPTATLTLTARNYPQTSDSGRTTDITVTSAQKQNQVRMRGRNVELKIASTQTATTWRLGATRIDLRPDGRR